MTAYNIYCFFDIQRILLQFLDLIYKTYKFRGSFVFRVECYISFSTKDNKKRISLLNTKIGYTSQGQCSVFENKQKEENTKKK